LKYRGQRKGVFPKILKNPGIRGILHHNPGLRPHHDQFILGNGGDRRLQKCDNILKSTKI
jgi:hypothetical protein